MRLEDCRMKSSGSQLVICTGNPWVFFAVPKPVPAQGVQVQPQVGESGPKGPLVPVPVAGNLRVCS